MDDDFEDLDDVEMDRLCSGVVTNGYVDAIESAGAVVKEFKRFGDHYNGIFIIVLGDGRIIDGAYGSCSTCDSFLREFDHYPELHIHDGKKTVFNFENFKEGCAECDLVKQRLKTFGESYLHQACSLEQLIGIYRRKTEELDYCAEDDLEVLKYLEKLEAHSAEQV